jgi:hypothetical protein
MRAKVIRFWSSRLKSGLRREFKVVNWTLSFFLKKNSKSFVVDFIRRQKGEKAFAFSGAIYLINT